MVQSLLICHRDPLFYLSSKSPASDTPDVITQSFPASSAYLPTQLILDTVY
jgi:hypothetical protein